VEGYHGGTWKEHAPARRRRRRRRRRHLDASKTFRRPSQRLRLPLLRRRHPRVLVRLMLQPRHLPPRILDHVPRVSQALGRVGFGFFRQGDFGACARDGARAVFVVGVVAVEEAAAAASAGGICVVNVVVGVGAGVGVVGASVEEGATWGWSGGPGLLSGFGTSEECHMEGFRV